MSTSIDIGMIEIEKVIGINSINRMVEEQTKNSDRSQIWSVTPLAISGHYKFSIDGSFLTGDSNSQLSTIGLYPSKSSIENGPFNQRGAVFNTE